jgi:DNA invertase Pin-like site-specific DNA recombinase
LKFGYARESIDEDNIEFQVDALNKYGVDEIYIEHPIGTKTKETKLNELIKKLRKGDILVVYKLDRLGKTIKGLQELAEYFSEKDIDLVVLKDNIDTTTNIGRYFLYTMCILGDMERSVLAEATKIGMKTAKAEGRSGGRPKKSKEEIQEVLKLYYSDKYSVEEISKMTDWGISTIYKYIREDKERRQKKEF